MKAFLEAIAVLLSIGLPLTFCILLGWRVWKETKLDWKVVACLAGLTIMTSLLLLIASDKIEILSIQEASLRTNRNLKEIEQLTEQNRSLTGRNKELAKRTAWALVKSTDGVLLVDHADVQGFHKAVLDLLVSAGIDQSEMEEVLKGHWATNKAPSILDMKLE
jgi:hypothetical protein